jgi:hypothetical protein
VGEQDSYSECIGQIQALGENLSNLIMLFIVFFSKAPAQPPAKKLKGSVSINASETRTRFENKRRRFVPLPFR